MVETRSRRKSAAPTAAAATPAPSGAAAAATAPSTSGRRAHHRTGSVAVDDHKDYADAYRRAALEQRRAEQSNIFRRLRARVGLFYHQQAMTWGWYMLEPWETVLWMSLLGLLCWLVVSACVFNPESACRSGLAACRRTLAAQGAKLLSLRR